MAKDICIFKRIEKKYIISNDEKEKLMGLISQYLIPDKYGKSTISSLYLDTPDFYIIRRSLEAKTYKEKLRLRCYGVPDSDTKVFLEIKKKFKGVVYKRRVAMTLKQAEDYLENGTKPEESQIMSEIDYAMELYKKPVPKAMISYEREAYFIKDMPNLRITFDTNVRFRTDNLFLEKGNQGTLLLPKETFIMEIKTDGAMPVWLSHALDDLKILPASFSKYGTAYRTHIFENTQQNTETGEKEYVLT